MKQDRWKTTLRPKAHKMGTGMKTLRRLNSRALKSIMHTNTNAFIHLQLHIYTSCYMECIYVKLFIYVYQLTLLEHIVEFLFEFIYFKVLYFYFENIIIYIIKNNSMEFQCFNINWNINVHSKKKNHEVSFPPVRYENISNVFYFLLSIDFTI